MCIIYINIIRFLEIKLRIYKFIPNDCRVILIYIYIFTRRVELDWCFLKYNELVKLRVSRWTRAHFFKLSRF